MSFDCLVIGAGPAGAMAALTLVRAGAKVCLIDRAAFPRPKLCGDTLNPGALAVLRRAGVSRDIEANGLPLEGMRVTGSGVAVDGRYPGDIRGLSIRRDLLDSCLVADAVSAGAEFRDRMRAGEALVRERPDGPRVVGVACTTGTGAPVDVAARVTIAADGRRSALAFGLGLTRHPASPRRWAIGVHAEGVHGMSAFGEMHIRAGHYIGVAPLPGGLANLCVVRPAAGAEEAFRDPAGTLRRALAEEPLLRDRTADARMVAKPLVLGPLAVDAVPGVRPPRGLLLAGDAAGFVDPMTGDGLRFALRGGELAAAAALRALEHGWDDVGASLHRARRAEFSGKWRFNRTLRSLVGSRLGVHGATAGARLAPAVVRALIRRASDCDLAVAP